MHLLVLLLALGSGTLSTRGPMHDEHIALIHAAAQAEGLDPLLLEAVRHVESGPDLQAALSQRPKSGAGAKGPFQLMDRTAASLGVKDPYDLQQSAAGAAKYLSQHHTRYDGDLDKTLAAYNAGPGNVAKHNGVPPFPETQNYITRVKDQLAALRAKQPPPDTQVYAPTDVGFSNPLAAAGRLLGF